MPQPTIHYTTSTTGADVTWGYWVSETLDNTYTTPVTTETIWSTWTSQITFRNQYLNHPVIDPVAERELRAEYERGREDRERALAISIKREKEANARAEALLLDNLTPEQQAQYRDRKHIIIVGGYSGTRYRVRHGRIGNIDVIDTLGRVSHRLCAHPRDEMPDADCVLIQKLALEADEEAFLKVANRHPSFDRVTTVLPPLESVPDLRLPSMPERLRNQ